MVLKQPESDWLDIIHAGKDLDTVNGVVVVLVVDEDPFLNDDLLVWVTDVNHAKSVVRHRGFSERRKRRPVAVPVLAGEHCHRYSCAKIVLNLVVKKIHCLRRRYDVDSVVSRF